MESIAPQPASGKKKLFSVFEFLRQMIENLSGDRYNDVEVEI